MASLIAKAKDLKNVSIGEVGVLFNTDLSDSLAFDEALTFDSADMQAEGWRYLGCTGQDTKFSQDLKMFDIKVGVPEFNLKSYVIGKEGAISGHFKEISTEMANLLAGQLGVKNYFATGDTAGVAITAVDGTAKTVTVAAASASRFAVGDTVIAAASGTDASCTNRATITEKATGATDCVLTFGNSWFTTLPTTSMTLRAPIYSVAQLGPDSATVCQVMLFYESSDGVQFIFHFPKCTITPNISPSLSSSSEELRLPFEAKMEGTPNTRHGDGNTNILGYFYERMKSA